MPVDAEFMEIETDSPENIPDAICGMPRNLQTDGDRG
jgi:hypothetical protein